MLLKTNFCNLSFLSMKMFKIFSGKENSYETHKVRFLLGVTKMVGLCLFGQKQCVSGLCRRTGKFFKLFYGLILKSALTSKFLQVLHLKNNTDSSCSKKSNDTRFLKTSISSFFSPFSGRNIR